MAQDITYIARLIDGTVKNISTSSNILVVSSIKIGLSPTELTETILSNLINLQNGSQIVFVANISGHAHDGRYFTESELGSVSLGVAGSTLIGDNNGYSNFTPTTSTIKGALAGIDTALGLISGGGYNIYQYTLISADVSNKYITLPATPKDASKTVVAIQSGPSQIYGYDFTVVNNILNFSTTYSDSLGNIIDVGDIIQILYN